MGASASFATQAETLASLQSFYESFIASQEDGEDVVAPALMAYQKGEEEAIDALFHVTDIADGELLIPDIDSIEEKNILLNGDCAGISSLEQFTEIQSKLAKFARFGLVMSNNQLNDTQFSSMIRDSCVLATTSTTKLTYLSLAGNAINDITSVLGTHLGEMQKEEGGEQVDISTRLHASISFNVLLVLDLSYIEVLNFGQQCPPFMGSPLLQRLVLDGCGLSSTLLGSTEIDVDAVISSEEEDKSIFMHSALTCSLFFGLTSLQELSLNENPLNDVASLAGLLYFRNAKLRDVCLKDTPLRETTALSSQVNSELSKLVGAGLKSIDNKNIVTSSKMATGVKLSHVSVGISSAENDNTDKEFIQALKGKRDNTVVA